MLSYLRRFSGSHLPILSGGGPSDISREILHKFRQLGRSMAGRSSMFTEKLHAQQTIDTYHGGGITPP